jgi:hypothetical protein
MIMGTQESIERIDPRGEIYTCPGCGYTDGFHVSFNLAGDRPEGELYLICPSCHRRYTVGWMVRFETGG